MTPDKPRVLLADDHTMFLAGLCSLLESEFELVGTAEDGRALLAAAPELQPEVVILDITMPLLNGIEAARQLRKSAPETKIIFLTMHVERAFIREAFRAGASGYVLKSSAPSELVTAIREVLRGRAYVTPMITKKMLDVWLEAGPEPEKLLPDLTPRQREVLQLVAEGHSVKQIASLLAISPKTVEFHKYRIMDELSVHSVAQLTQYAIRHGMISS